MSLRLLVTGLASVSLFACSLVDDFSKFSEGPGPDGIDGGAGDAGEQGDAAGPDDADTTVDGGAQDAGEPDAAMDCTGLLDCDNDGVCEQPVDRNHCEACDAVCGPLQACSSNGCAELGHGFLLPLETTGSRRITSLDVDQNGASYITFYNRETATLGDVEFAGGSNSLFQHHVAQIGVDGDVAWSRSYVPAGTSPLMSVTAVRVSRDALALNYVAGYYRGRPSLAGVTGRTADDYDAFVQGLAPDGTHRWTRYLTGSNTQSTRALAIDEEGNVYVLGQFFGELKFGSQDWSEGATRGGFVVKFNAAGSWQWHRVFPDTYFSTIATGGGRVFLHGVLEGTVTLGGTQVTNELFKDLVFALDGTDGSLVWDKLVDADGLSYGEEWGASANADPDGNLYIWHGYDCSDAGCGELPVDLGAGPVEEGMFLVSFDRDGEYRFGRVFEGTLDLAGASVGGIRVGRDGTVLLAGQVRNGGDFGGGTVEGLDNSSNRADLIVAGYDASTGAFLWSTRLGSTASGSERGYEAMTTADGRRLLTTAQLNDVLLIGGEVFTAGPGGKDVLWGASVPQ